MRYSSTRFRLFDFAFMILSSHTPSAASLTARSPILESVFECLFRRSLSQLFQTHPGRYALRHAHPRNLSGTEFSFSKRQCALWRAGNRWELLKPAVSG